ncbi:MAG: thermonuclease family protein [Alphaproteobacteria bacterium]
MQGAIIPVIWIGILAILLVGIVPAEARDYRGEVVAVTDGDTLTMRAGNNRRMIIRLADIDAPEKRQPYGMEAKQSLAGLAQGQAVIVNKQTKDKYSRTVGTVYRSSDALNLNQEMTKRGNAWAYRAYLQDTSIIALEQAAEAQKIGLWSLPPEERIPPWEWRKEQRESH